jgi:hypothetical protein
MGGKNSGADEAKKARQDEEARQKRIREGTQRINGIFDGTTVGDGALGADAAFDPNGAYYNADGTRWSPVATAAPSTGGGKQGGQNFAVQTSGAGALNQFSQFGKSPSSGAKSPLAAFDGLGRFGGAAGSGGKASGSPTSPLTAEEQFAKLRAEGKLFSSTKNSGGFNDAFYKGRRDAYTAFATPQLEDQYGKAGRDLTFSLDRSGLLDSSVRGDKLSELQKLYDLQKQQIADKALSYETTARNSVEDARANLISTLNATGDAEGAASSALARSQALSAPADYSSLGQLFTDFTSTLGTQAAQERSYAAGGPKPAYNTGLFGSTGRVTVA